LVYGVGQLGSRYLQGLVSSGIPLTIYIYDISDDSVRNALCRWHEVNGDDSIHDLIILTNFQKIPSIIDLVIVATTADVRLSAIKIVSHFSFVRYWILEKVIAQNIEDLTLIGTLLSGSLAAWVNTPRRASEWYYKIKQNSNISSPIELNLCASNWGMACNAVHYLDLVAWWSGEELINLKVGRESFNWVPSKRPGFFEVEGELIANFSNGSSAILASRPDLSCNSLKISSGVIDVVIDEIDGYAFLPNSSVIRGKLELQSEMTAGMVESILTYGKCDLPKFIESSNLHKIFLIEMLDCWRSFRNSSDISVPIT
jgi:hypothetical protein